jgi:hypothetical protein
MTANHHKADIFGKRFPFKLWFLCAIERTLEGHRLTAALTLIFYPLDDLAKRHFTVAREMFDELPSESVNVS